MAFSWGVVKSSSWVRIWKYCYFKWGVRLHLDGFGVFISLYTIFQALWPWKDLLAKFEVNLLKIWRKIQESAKRFLPISKLTDNSQSLHKLYSITHNAKLKTELKRYILIKTTCDTCTAVSDKSNMSSAKLEASVKTHLHNFVVL